MRYQSGGLFVHWCQLDVTFHVICPWRKFSQKWFVTDKIHMDIFTHWDFLLFCLISWFPYFLNSWFFKYSFSPFLAYFSGCFFHFSWLHCWHSGWKKKEMLEAQEERTQKGEDKGQKYYYARYLWYIEFICDHSSIYFLHFRKLRVQGRGSRVKFWIFFGDSICYSPDFLVFKMGSFLSEVLTVAEIWRDEVSHFSHFSGL